MSATPRPQPEESSYRADNAERAADSVLLEWTVHLAHQNPRRMWGVAVALVLAFVGGLLAGSVVFSVVGALLILSSAAEFVFPIRHRLTRSGASCAYGWSRYEMKWADVRRILRARDGVKLSPLPFASRLDNFRGVLLRFAPSGSPGSREDALKIVEQYAAAASDQSKEEQVSAGV